MENLRQHQTPALSPTAPKPKVPERVISLLGAATETIYRLGLSHTLVGRSHECDYPPDVLSLPCISRPRLDPLASSLDIDTVVRSKAAKGEPIYKLDEEVLGDKVGNFDLWIAQDHCRVCAITPKDLQQSKHIAAQARQVKALSSDCNQDENQEQEQCYVDLNVQQLILKPSTLEDCLDDVLKIANAMGVSDRGIALKNTLQQRLDRVTHLVNTKSESPFTTAPAPESAPRVALLEWCDPIMGCGYWIPELIELAGGRALHCPPAGSGGGTPTISIDTLIDSKPDVVIFALCGFGLTRATKEIMESSVFRVRSASGSNKTNEMDQIERLKQVCNGQMYVIDGNYLVNRSGPRVIESCEALVEAIHPELRGHFGHFGTELLTTYDKAVNMVEQGFMTGSKKIRPEPFVEECNEEKGLTHTDVDTDTKQKGHTSQQQMKHDIMLGPLTIGESADKVVTKQVRYLEAGDMKSAFALNSQANQGRWCGHERFTTVLRSNDDFKRLLEEPASIGITEVKDDIATVRVSLPENGENGQGAVELIWTMVAELQRINDCDKSLAWRTEKVGMAH